MGLVYGHQKPGTGLSKGRFEVLVLGGSWDLVTRVISKVTIVVIAYNPN